MRRNGSSREGVKAASSMCKSTSMGKTTKSGESPAEGRENANNVLATVLIGPLASRMSACWQGYNAFPA